MSPNLNCLILVFFLAAYSFEPCFSALFVELDESVDLVQRYDSIRDKSTYRGLLFTFSHTLKNQLCDDIAKMQDDDDDVSSAQNEPKSPNSETDGIPKYADDVSSARNKAELASSVAGGIQKHDADVSSTRKENQPEPLDTDKQKFPIIMRKITISNSPVSEVPTLFFECTAKNQESGQPIKMNTVYVSSAFHPNWFFAFFQTDDQVDALDLHFYIVMSPEYVPYQQDQLEKRYTSIRQRIKFLTEEFPDWRKLIERNDDLSTLTKTKKYMLCASILTTPEYRIEGIELSVSWLENQESSLEYETELLTFMDDKFAGEEWETDCIPCKVINDQTTQPEYIYLTRSYDDENSLYVLIKKNERIMLDKYFKNIPVLINADENLLGSHVLTDYD